MLDARLLEPLTTARRREPHGGQRRLATSAHAGLPAWWDAVARVVPMRDRGAGFRDWRCAVDEPSGDAAQAQATAGGSQGTEQAPSPPSDTTQWVAPHC